MGDSGHIYSEVFSLANGKTADLPTGGRIGTGYGRFRENPKTDTRGTGMGYL
jgi:hypothetical protein